MVADVGLFDRSLDIWTPFELLIIDLLSCNSVAVVVWAYFRSFSKMVRKCAPPLSSDDDLSLWFD